GTDFRIWNEVSAALEPNYRVVLYDKRGHGLSEATPQPYRMDDHVSDLAALLDHLGVKQAVVVGLSVGGMIAQGIAAARPDLVKALVLCDTAHRSAPPRPGTRALTPSMQTALPRSVTRSWNAGSPPATALRKTRTSPATPTCSPARRSTAMRA